MKATEDQVVTDLTSQISQLSLESQQEKDIQDLFLKEMGFSLVVQELINAKKPIVGHNMIYDIIYLYNQFIDYLPETYTEFINKVIS